MIDIPVIFRNKQLDAEKLAEYGFFRSEDGFSKDFLVMKDQYMVRINVSPEGSVDFRASVFLDDRLKDDETLEMVNKSYSLVNS